MRWFVLASLFTITACASMPGARPEYDAGYADTIRAEAPSASATPDPGQRGQFSLGSSLSYGEKSGATSKRVAVDPRPDAGRRMIYEAAFGIRVANPDDAIDAFVRRVESAGGYLVEKRDRKVTCRVPADKFAETVGTVRSSGQVLHDHVTAQDVTREYMDTEIRLENAEKSRARLLELLEKADAVEAILKIEEQVTRLTEQIERMKGELRYMTERISFSLITVEYQAPAVTRGRTTGQPSRFPWINAVGIRAVLERF